MGSWKYGYDNLNRVTSGVTSSGPYPGYSDCFAYDPWGNRTGEAFSTTTCGSSPTPTTWANYNANNQITGTGLMPAGYGYDAAGNVLNCGVNQYLYDNEERVCTLTIRLGSDDSLHLPFPQCPVAREALLITCSISELCWLRCSSETDKPRTPFSHH